MTPYEMVDTTGSSAIRLLIVNPNSSKEMTHGMEKAIEKMGLPSSVKITTYTGPSNSPASINDGNDVKASTTAVLADLATKNNNFLSQYDGVLVACYSVHPLVDQLASLGSHTTTGIFEASILACLALLPANSTGSASATSARQWGIVTTGKYWEAHLAEGTRHFLGEGQGTQVHNLKFAGVQTSGLDAGDFHSVDPEVVRQKLSEAATRLFKSGDVACAVMGCAGMAGLEDIIRAAAVSCYGEEKGRAVAIVDAVKAGIFALELMVRSKRAFVA